MRLKINKACDLNSISVLPPPSRRLNAANSGPATSILGGSGGGGGGQNSLVRTQPSQQSFSQGISSQHGMFSQFSQSSHEDVITTDQRFGSQERDHSAKKISCLAPTYSRDESQMPISRSSNNVMRKWSSNSSQDHKGQSSEELEHRMTMIETSVSRIGMILDSVQNDAMQGNKGTKELSIQLDVLRQKTTSLDESIHQLNRRQEDVKTSLEGGLKSIFDQLNKSTLQDKSQEILPVVRTLPDLIEGSLQRVKNELWKSFIKASNQQFPPALLQPKLTGRDSSSQVLYVERSMFKLLRCFLTNMLTVKVLIKGFLIDAREPVPVAISKPEPPIPKMETVAWKSVKAEKCSFGGKFSKEQKHKRISSNEQSKRIPLAKEWTVLMDSDEDVNEDGSIFLVENDKGCYHLLSAHHNNCLSYFEMHHFKDGRLRGAIAMYSQAYVSIKDLDLL
ncbi:LOW QUALITY PROTEIN: hypothetical protein V2J09_024270 [Rumex salicifolius]